MACVGWALQGHAAPWWMRPRESIHSTYYLLYRYIYYLLCLLYSNSCKVVRITMVLRELVEATLHGRDERMVAKCDVAAILGIFDS